jgi:hypothetical protein
MIRAGALALVVALGGGTAAAQGQGFRMLNDSSNPFPYYIDGRYPEPVPGILLSDVQTATDQAWATWQAVPCNDDAFLSLGPSTNNPNIIDPEDPSEAYNVSSIWLVDAGDPYWNVVLDVDIMSAAVPTAYGGVLSTCDIYLAGIDFDWTLSPPCNDSCSNWVDLQSVLLREAGHCQGLGDTSNIGDVMFAEGPLDYVKRELSTNDVQAICQQAPKVGAIGSACSAGPCAPGSSCVQPAPPDGGASEAVCSQGCDPMSTIAQCPPPFICMPSTLIPDSTGACLAPTAGFVTQVGMACTQDQDCGSANGACLQPAALPSGANAWVAGYCTQSCGPQYAPCPANSSCQDYGLATNICLQTCRPGSADCRPNYACAAIGDGSEGVCVPGCHSNDDCNQAGGNYICRTCDGLCLATQDPTAQLGDPCTSPSSCPAGDVCLGFGANPDSGICAQACGTTCSACAGGSSCRPVGADGVLYCLLDCAGGACPDGLQCSETSAGLSCLPACGSSADCPVGDSCLGGQCVSPDAGGGSCPLCFADSGIPPPPPDAGPLMGGNGGCGCQVADEFGLLAWVVVLCALGGRRAWRSQ